MLSAQFVSGKPEVVSVGLDGSVRVWNWAYALPQAVLPSSVTIAFTGGPVFSKDGKSIYELREDGSVRSWVPGGRATVIVPPGSGGSTLAVSGDDTHLAIGGFDGPIQVHDLGSAPTAAPATLTGHKGPVWSMAMDQSGGRLVTGGDDGTVRLWDTSTGRGRILGRHEGATVLTVALSPDGTRVASGDSTGVVRVWSADGSADPVDLKGHEGYAYDVGFSPDGRRLASGASDRTVRVWDLATGLGTVLGSHATAVFTARFSPDGRTVVSSSLDGTRVWDWSKRIVLFEPPGPSYGTARATLSPDGTLLAIGTVSDQVRVMSCETCGPIDKVRALARQRVTRSLTPDEEETFGG